MSLGTPRSFNQFYSRFVTARSRQLRIAGNQRCIENFTEDDISGVICCHGVTQHPDSIQQLLVLRAFDVECDVIVEGLPAPGRGDLFEAYEAAECLRDLDINQMGSVETLSGAQHPLLYLDALVRAQQKLEYG
jgi:hypothetical protein